MDQVEFACDVTNQLRSVLIGKVFILEERTAGGWSVLARVDGPKAYREMGLELDRLSREMVAKIVQAGRAHQLPPIERYRCPPGRRPLSLPWTK